MEEETPHWKNEKISSKLLNKFIGKSCEIHFKKAFYIQAYNEYKAFLNGVINEYDDKFIDVSISVTNKVKKENITKKYNYLIELDNILAIGIEEK